MNEAQSNPYPDAQAYPAGYYSSHYAQAYMQPTQGSSSWTSLPSYSAPPMSLSSRTAGGPSRPPPPLRNSWYQPGNHRCNYKDCTFTGSQKSVEVHKMDRHLIYPLGFDRRKKKLDWDADPSLIGKPIPIQGTSVNLSDPETLEKWIAERKKRWPSTPRVEEKNRKIEEAVARGQIDADDAGLAGHKRRRLNQHGSSWSSDPASRGRGAPRGRSLETGRGRGLSRPHNYLQTHALPAATRPPEPLLSAQDANCLNQISSSSDDDEAPESMTSKAPLLLDLDIARGDWCGLPSAPDCPADAPEQTPWTKSVPAVKKPRPHKPRQPPLNPFAPRRSLLRKLLLPEIRVTVSNLSQAIRFLVENDFLRDVEMKPGEADENMIEVIAESPAA